MAGLFSGPPTSLELKGFPRGELLRWNGAIVERDQDLPCGLKGCMVHTTKGVCLPPTVLPDSLRGPAYRSPSAL